MTTALAKPATPSQQFLKLLTRITRAGQPDVNDLISGPYHIYMDHDSDSGDIDFDFYFHEELILRYEGRRLWLGGERIVGGTYYDRTPGEQVAIKARIKAAMTQLNYLVDVAAEHRPVTRRTQYMPGSIGAF
jgi:hypothetical protein